MNTYSIVFNGVRHVVFVTDANGVTWNTQHGYTDRNDAETYIARCIYTDRKGNRPIF